jgi:hypothetical protein
MADLVVGCPVARRDWIMPTWFTYVMIACDKAGLEPEFVFVVPKWDEDTKECISTCLDAGANMWKFDVIETDEPHVPERREPHPGGYWSRQRLEGMVELRNQLLRRVRQIAPRFFWSLDSDILPAPNALAHAVNSAELHPDCGAVGMHTYMSETGLRIDASRAQLVGNALRGRQVYDSELEGDYPTDVVMGAIVMKPAAYNIDYSYNFQGEDVGWAINCHAAGVKFRWCAPALCKHVMNRGMLNTIDRRIGF